jgi:hypothetical protein
VGLEAAFAPEHKHLFNEFGISLRKSRMVDQSIEYSTRALALTSTDENLHYNVARAYFEKGDTEKVPRAPERGPASESGPRRSQKIPGIPGQEVGRHAPGALPAYRPASRPAGGVLRLRRAESAFAVAPGANCV